mgnify:CR=1 FL=1
MASKYSKIAGFEDKAKINDKDLITSKEDNMKKIKDEQQEALENPQV